MGARLAREVSDNWGHLAAGPYKVLMRMALGSLDKSEDPARPAGHYWKGWADLALALGRDVPDADDDSPEAAVRRRTIKSEVKRHTNILVDQKAVRRVVDNPGRTLRQVWQLTLE